MMAREERNDLRARDSSIDELDERDHAILLGLLEHKILTTTQLKILFFRSLRRCQHRLRELRELGHIASFTPRRGFGEGRPPACWFLTRLGLSTCADNKGVKPSDLSWIPDEGYRRNQNLPHRLGVNAFFCALVEASRGREGHCLATWRPERRVRTGAAEVKPDGFGRYLHPGGACEFYFEYDRGTEAFGALARKLEGYLRLGAGWTEEQELTGFPNLLLLVPEDEREEGVASAFRSAVGTLHASGALASSLPLYVASGDRLAKVGVLGPAWRHIPTDGGHLSLLDLPARPREMYWTTRCLGRYFTDEHARRRISPISTTPRFPALPPRHAP